MKKKNHMRTITTALFLVGLLVGSVLFVGWRFQVRNQAPPPGHLAAVVDTSTSVPRNCDALVATVKAELGNLNITKGSHFALITTGSSASKFEPVLALDTEIPRNTIFGGANGGNTREEFFGQIKHACEQFSAADGSSIFRAAEIGIEHMRTFGCADASNCHLIISSDLEENMNDAIRTRVYRGSEPASPALLDNTGIAITFCGYTQTTESGGPRTEAQSLVDGWKRLFKHPVTFRPYCGTAENESTASTTAR